MTSSKNMTRMYPSTFLAAVALLTTGCATNMSTTTISAPVAFAGPHLTGPVYGGRQPLSGATLHLYAASTAGYSATNTDLLTSTVQMGGATLGATQ